MITVDDKLYITKEVNNVILRFAKEIVLRRLLNLYTYGSENEKSELTELLIIVSHYNGDLPPPEQQLEMLGFLSEFIRKLSIEERTALNFWVLNQRYLRYLEETEITSKHMKMEQFNQEYGRELAYKLYNPVGSGLDDDLQEELTTFLTHFSIEMDFSLIDEHTFEDVSDMIKSYCE